MNKEKKSIITSFLTAVEHIGNKLPHPITLFALFALAIILISAVADAYNLSVVGDIIDRSTNEIKRQSITPNSLLSRDGLSFIFTSSVTNFTSFAPLGTVLVSMLGVGVAESSGLISAMLKGAVKITPKKLIAPTVVFLGIMSNVASDAGYVVLIPVGALMFSAYGRHPLAGIAAAFAGVSGGFSANLIIGTLDPMLAGITTEAVKMVDPNYTVEATANWYFMIVSTFLITIIGWIVTDFIVEPKLRTANAWEGNADTIASSLEKSEVRGLVAAGISIFVFIGIIIALLYPQSSFLRNSETGSIMENSPFMASIIPLIALFFLIPAVTYGFSSGAFKSERDVCKALEESMSAMGGYIALAFVAAQFIAYFEYTNLGTIIAVSGAEFFENSGIGAIPLMLLFVLFSAFINLFMGSASAKWTILAPVFVPMFMLLGYSPELTQMAFRIGDSCTNIITPLMSYFAMIVVFLKKYDPKCGMGTLISTMLPYSISFLLGWFTLLVIWIAAELPPGPGVEIFL